MYQGSPGPCLLESKTIRPSLHNSDWALKSLLELEFGTMCSFMPDELGCHKLLTIVIRQVTSTRDQFMLGADLDLRLPCFIFV